MTYVGTAVSVNVKLTKLLFYRYSCQYLTSVSRLLTFKWLLKLKPFSYNCRPRNLMHEKLSKYVLK